MLWCKILRTSHHKRTDQLSDWMIEKFSQTNVWFLVPMWHHIFISSLLWVSDYWWTVSRVFLSICPWMQHRLKRLFFGAVWMCSSLGTAVRGVFSCTGTWLIPSVETRWMMIPGVAELPQVRGTAFNSWLKEENRDLKRSTFSSEVIN